MLQHDSIPAFMMASHEDREIALRAFVAFYLTRCNSRRELTHSSTPYVDS